MAGESLACQTDRARLTTRRRLATASLSGEVAAGRTYSRSSRGSGKDGGGRENAAGRSAPHLCCAQVWHSSMCQADQFARFLSQLPVPVGQQLTQHRASRPPGQRDVQRTQGLLKLAAGTCRQGVRPAP